VIITAYNLHVGSFSRALVVAAQQLYSGPGADLVIKSQRAQRSTEEKNGVWLCETLCPLWLLLFQSQLREKAAGTHLTTEATEEHRGRLEGVES
jgi:hypothetical protein